MGDSVEVLSAKALEIYNSLTRKRVESAPPQTRVAVVHRNGVGNKLTVFEVPPAVGRENRTISTKPLFERPYAQGCNVGTALREGFEEHGVVPAPTFVLREIRPTGGRKPYIEHVGQYDPREGRFVMSDTQGIKKYLP